MCRKSAAFTFVILEFVILSSGCPWGCSRPTYPSPSSTHRQFTGGSEFFFFPELLLVGGMPWRLLLARAVCSSQRQSLRLLLPRLPTQADCQHGSISPSIWSAAATVSPWAPPQQQEPSQQH